MAESGWSALDRMRLESDLRHCRLVSSIMYIDLSLDGGASRMDRRSQAIQGRLEWFAQRRGIPLSEVFSLKFRPLKRKSANPTGYMYPGEYRFALAALPEPRDLPVGEPPPPWGDDFPIGRKPVKVIPSYGNGIWVQHESGLELLLTFEFIEHVKTLYDVSKGFVEVAGNPMLLVDLLGLAVGINAGKIPASQSDKRPIENDRYEGHRDVEEIVVEKRCFRPDGTLSEAIVIRVPLGAKLDDTNHAALIAELGSC